MKRSGALATLLTALLAGSLAAQQVAPPVANADLVAIKARAYQLYEAKEFNAAATQFQAYLARRPDDPRALFDYAGLLAELNRHEEAARQLELLHQQRPQHDAGYFRLGITYILLGRTADAGQVFTQLQQSTNPEMAAAAREALQKLRGEQTRAARVQAESQVFALARESKFAEVVAAVAELEKQQEVSYRLHLQRIYALGVLKQHQDALARAEKLAVTYPATPELALVRADLLSHLNRRSEAESIWREIIERLPGTPFAAEAARRLTERTLPPPEDHIYDLVREPRHREALTAIEEMERKGPLPWSMEMQRLYSLRALDEHESAFAKANELATRYPDAVDLALFRADLLVGRREWSQAAEILKPLTREPDSPAGRAATDRLWALPPVANLDKWYWGEAYASGDYLGRYGTVVGSGFIRQGTFIPEARWLQPYGEFRFSVDTRSGTGARETVISDNAVGLYGGARIQLFPTEYVFIYGQGGINKDLLDQRENGDWALDYQVGVYGFKSWGPGVVLYKSAPAAAQARAQQGDATDWDGASWFWRGDWFVDVGANFSYYDRYRSWIGYGQAHEGFRLAQYGPNLAFDAYVLENLTWDVHGNFFDNYFEIGPGARAIWSPHPNWAVILNAEWLAGFYFGRDELGNRNGTSGQFDGVHVALSVGARW